MKLYSFWRSLATYRVRMVLNLKGIEPDEVIDINLMKGQQREAAFRAVNPMMAIPALVDGDGPALFESLAIIEYLDETHPQPPLLPKDPRGRARVRALAQLIACDSHPLVVPRVREYLEHELKLDEADPHQVVPALDHAGAHGVRDQPRRQGDRPLLPRRQPHGGGHLPRQPGGGREVLRGRHDAVPDREPHRRHVPRDRCDRARPSAEAAGRAGVGVSASAVGWAKRAASVQQLIVDARRAHRAAMRGHGAPRVSRATQAARLRTPTTLRAARASASASSSASSQMSWMCATSASKRSRNSRACVVSVRRAGWITMHSMCSGGSVIGLTMRSPGRCRSPRSRSAAPSPSRSARRIRACPSWHPFPASRRPRRRGSGNRSRDCAGARCPGRARRS